MEKGEAGGSTRSDRRRRGWAVAVGAILLVVLGGALVLRPTAPPAPISTAPSPPSGVRGTAGDGQVTIAWDAATNAQGYHVYRASNPGVTKEHYAGLPDGARYRDVVSPYTIVGLTNGRPYYFRVTAFSSAGESDVSAEISILPVPADVPANPTPPRSPEGLRAVAGDEQLTLDWHPVVGADGYHAYRASAPGITKEGHAGLPDGAKHEHVAAPYTITGLANDRVYYVRVTAFNEIGESDVSAEISAMPLGEPLMTAPPAPTNVAAIPGNGQITISWGLVPGAPAYHVYQASQSGVTKAGYESMPDGVRYANVASPYILSGLVVGRIYYLRVTAENAAGESDESAEISATPTGVPPATTPSAPAVIGALAAETFIVVSWDSVDGANQYHVYQASMPGITKAGYASMPDGARFTNVASPYTIAGLAIGRTYYYRVTAENPAGESDESAEASATPTGPPSGADLFVSGVVEFDTGASVADAAVTLRTEDGSAVATGRTGADGSFNVGLRAMLPARVLAEVRYESAGYPPVTGFRWSPVVEGAGAVALGRIALPDPATKQLLMAGTTAVAADGSVIAESFPANVAAIWARPYDPDASPDVFPGDLAERRDYPLNSVVFLWISALDASGTPVIDVDPPATVRMRIPATQWVDAEDLQPGNGVIDTPIYSLDYASAYWVREPYGILTDAAGVPISEAFEADIRAGTYAGEVYAEFQATHFSWWNVDKPPSDCGPDFGDAEDPGYPSFLGSDGARHRDICRAWLGAWVDAEDEADVPNADRYDDGLVAGTLLKLRVSNWNWEHALFVNALIDHNDDGDWEDAGEWVIRNLAFRAPTGKVMHVQTDTAWNGESYLRLTLTGSPITNYVGKGEFEIGETEDYPFVAYGLSVSVSGNGTITSDPPAISCRKSPGGACFAQLRAGTVVQLTADPDSGESFIGWGAYCSGSNATCTVIMRESRYVSASFTQPYYRLVVYIMGTNQTGNLAGGKVTSDPPGIRCSGNYSDPGGNQTDCIAVFPRGTSVLLTAIPDPGWVFLRWGGDCAGTVPTCSVSMNRDRWVVAYFGWS